MLVILMVAFGVIFSVIIVNVSQSEKPVPAWIDKVRNYEHNYFLSKSNHHHSKLFFCSI